MSKQNKSVKSVKRGRKHIALTLPKTARFTITDIMAVNEAAGNKVCRLTVYNQINDGTLQIKATKDTKETGTVGKPGTYFIRTALWEKNRQAAKAKRTKATAPTVDLTPAPAAEVPVTAEAETVAVS